MKNTCFLGWQTEFFFKFFYVGTCTPCLLLPSPHLGLALPASSCPAVLPLWPIFSLSTMKNIRFFSCLREEISNMRKNQCKRRKFSYWVKATLMQTQNVAKWKVMLTLFSMKWLRSVPRLVVCLMLNHYSVDPTMQLCIKAALLAQVLKDKHNAPLPLIWALIKLPISRFLEIIFKRHHGDCCKENRDNSAFWICGMIQKKKNKNALMIFQPLRQKKTL